MRKLPDLRHAAHKLLTAMLAGPGTFYQICERADIDVESKRVENGQRALFDAMVDAGHAKFDGNAYSLTIAARVASLEPEDHDILRFMLGVKQSPRSQWGNRNVYLCNRRDLSSMARLVAAGFVRAGEPILQMRYYHATAAGCKLAGLNGSAIRRAMGDRS